MAREPGVEIFSIGTELVMGRIQDTNAFWMAQELVGLGALVRRITVLPDDPDTGILQINSSVHGKRAKQLGYNLNTLEGNLGYGLLLYQEEGVRPWSASAFCWSAEV